MQDRIMTWGYVKAASRTAPSPASELNYDIEVVIDGQAQVYESVVPAYRTVEDAPDEVDLFPFRVDQRVAVSIERVGSRLDIEIHDQEQPSFKRCE